jgi:hypothetical protein
MQIANAEFAVRSACNGYEEYMFMSSGLRIDS